MKQFLFLLLLAPLLSFGQFKHIKVPATKYGQYGAQANAVIWTPLEHKDSLHKTYPVIIWFHGRGQGTNNINDIYGDGLLKIMQAGKYPEAKDPVTGELKKFIVVAVQWEGSPYPAVMTPAWEYIKATQGLRMDTTRIYTSGLSSGGECSLDFPISDTVYTKMVAAIVSASPMDMDAYYKPLVPRLAQYKVPVRFYVGEYETVFLNSAKYLMSVINKDTGLAAITTFKGGHGPWTQLFDNTVKFAWKGQQLNWLEWLLTNRRAPAKPVDPPSPPADTAKVLQIMHDPARVQKIIILDKDGTWTEYQGNTITSGKLKLEFQ